MYEGLTTAFHRVVPMSLNSHQDFDTGDTVIFGHIYGFRFLTRRYSMAELIEISDPTTFVQMEFGDAMREAWFGFIESSGVDWNTYWDIP